MFISALAVRPSLAFSTSIALSSAGLPDNTPWIRRFSRRIRLTCPRIPKHTLPGADEVGTPARIALPKITGRCDPKPAPGV